MKVSLTCALFFFTAGCTSHTNNQKELQSRIDSLYNKINNAYTPGLGEFMSSIQLHHAKLWFAGKNGNWELAEFELGEIQETMDDIQKFNRDRPEITELPIIKIPLDSVKMAVSEKNPAAFKKSFILLTNGCNTCHQATKHGFNVIKIPDVPPVTNQSFEKHL
jgi:hypothetical protein